VTAKKPDPQPVDEPVDEEAPETVVLATGRPDFLLGSHDGDWPTVTGEGTEMTREQADAALAGAELAMIHLKEL
jgi:hypothetical protein